jgi:L-2-hydroxyglutarate oxidase
MQKAEVVIVGGGILGLATAYHLIQQYPGKKVVVLEKEKGLAQHQSGHNSGVLHSGIYYKPGSMKAINCRKGKKAMEVFCEKEEIAYDICGKVIVALDESERPALQQIYECGQANHVRCALIDKDRLKDLEPHAAGIQALHIPEAGIVDYKQVCQRLAERVNEAEGRIVTMARVTAIQPNKSQIVVESTAGAFEADYVVNCAGLHCDRVTKLSGQKAEAKIVPFRGEYYKLKPRAHYLCKNLIYPVPNPSLPFLGVHFTRMIYGGVECGPNAVLAFAREGYTPKDINLRDLFETVMYPGFVRFSLKYWRIGMEEMWRSFSKAAFVNVLQRLLPEITSADLDPAPSGVRAQALGRDGNMVDDFLIQETDRMVNVCNAPSPAATASLNIGKLIVEKLATRFN